VKIETVPTLALGALVLAGCIDFGYRLPPPPDAPDAPVLPDGNGSACTEGIAPPSDTGPQISIITLNVNVPVLAIHIGEVVTWTNTDSMAHTVTAGAPGAMLPPAQGGFDSGDIAAGGKWAYRFCTARSVVYFCKTHASQMNNYRVTVGP
jgi:plastocyanin